MNSGQLAFFFGGILLLVGMIAHLHHIRLCKRIVAATANQPDGLQRIETWLNIFQFRKRRKLNFIVSTEPLESELRSWASAALKAEVLSYCLLVPGMLLMVIGVALQG